MLLCTAALRQIFLFPQAYYQYLYDNLLFRFSQEAFFSCLLFLQELLFFCLSGCQKFLDLLQALLL